MSAFSKKKDEILSKLGIEALNPMQLAAHDAIRSHNEVVLLSPTGTGKTLAFLLPILQELNPTLDEIQAMIVVPSRELAIQIEQVFRDMGSGYKVNAVYGGRSGSKDKLEIKHRPAVLIGTPGRLADHLRRASFGKRALKTLVLDEFDKSLEVGFESEMKEIINKLPHLNKKILTSATRGVQIPDFVGITLPETVNFLHEKKSVLAIQKVESPSKDKLETLGKLLANLPGKRGIVFCNFKDSINRVSDFLEENGIAHGIFYGGMEQIDRERSLIKFRNETHNVLLATDLAARGIDVPELDYIIHYHLPLKAEEFTHRNGRTARMHSSGTAYVIQGKGEELPEFIGDPDSLVLQDAPAPAASGWTTLFISGGRKDKISKGDIAGLFFKQGGLSKDELGVIELKTDCAFVSVKKAKVKAVVNEVNNTRLKKKKVRIFEI